MFPDVGAIFVMRYDRVPNDAQEILSLTYVNQCHVMIYLEIVTILEETDSSVQFLKYNNK